jgi:GAF domain-containing protein
VKVYEPMEFTEFTTQQSRLKSLAGEALREYRNNLDTELRDPQRLAVAYGEAFANADFKRQAEVVAELATMRLDVPNADVNIITDTAQLAIAAIRKGNLSYPPPETALGESYCKHVIGTGMPLAVEDSMDHPLVCDTRLAIEGKIVSYLGVPVADRNKIVIGVLCVHTPYERQWSKQDVEALTQLSLILTQTL